MLQRIVAAYKDKTIHKMTEMKDEKPMTRTFVRTPYIVSDSPFFMILSDFAPVCSSFATAKAIDRFFPPLLRSWFSGNLSATATDHINLDHMVHFWSR
jgi:hypothetical protein